MPLSGKVLPSESVEREERVAQDVSTGCDRSFACVGQMQVIRNRWRPCGVAVVIGLLTASAYPRRRALPYRELCKWNFGVVHDISVSAPVLPAFGQMPVGNFDLINV